MVCNPLSMAQKAGVDTRIAQCERFTINTHSSVLQRSNEFFRCIHEPEEMGAMLPAVEIGCGDKDFERRIACAGPMPVNEASIRVAPFCAATIEFATPSDKL